MRATPERLRGELLMIKHYSERHFTLLCCYYRLIPILQVNRSELVAPLVLLLDLFRTEPLEPLATTIFTVHLTAAFLESLHFASCLLKEILWG